MGNGLVVSPLFIIRIVTVIVGIVVLGIGLHSHFQSDWPHIQIPNRNHHICSYNDDDTQLSLLKCPKLAMERFYVCIIVIFFIFSLFALVAAMIFDLRNHPLNSIDMVYHALGTILLFIAASLYITSAVQIENLKGIKDFTVVEPGGGASSPLKDFLSVKQLRFEEKVIAGVFTLILSIIYFIASVMIGLHHFSVKKLDYDINNSG